MKNIKKILGIFSLLALVFALVACGPQEDSGQATGDEGKKEDNNKEYDLLVWEDVEKSEGIADAVAKFEEENDVKVKVVEKAYAQQIEDLRLDGPGGTGPDVFTMPGDQIGTAVVEGLLKELNVGEDVTSIYTEAAMNSQTVDGKVYGLPKAVETTMLFYNKDIVSEDELPTTLDGWYDLSKELTDGENFGLLALFDQIYYANSVLSGYGGYIFGQDENGNYIPTDLGLNNEGAIEGANQIQKFYAEKLFPSGIIGEQGIQVLDSLFSEGKAAAVISGPWNLGPYEEAGIDYGVVKLPELANGENMSAFVGVKSYNVSAYSKNAELAEKLVVFLANEENSKTRYELTKEVPAVAALADDPAVTESEAAQAVAEQSQFSELMPNIPEMNSVWDPADAALQTIATGKAEPKEALDQAVETIKGSIEAANSSK
ncbi:sugar ABC transporter substrate-binding protein [Aquibacillus salsiterrae]|uniref:Maltodextrin-binding protein n=1 Tax=Aquibacillus salsiterrae TaxID=2950439 RepID=A0A9X3WF30_9BACI|nr:extracellular solute-binding protein [Aquibacillus salsiterrae]MDC3415876.1 extracellular solute-binding protein [Aquibacillus salsiterrae]